MARICDHCTIDGISFLSSNTPFKIKKTNTIWVCLHCYKGFVPKYKLNHLRLCKPKTLQ